MAKAVTKPVRSSDLPYNSDAEKAVLGSALISKDCLYTVLSALEEKDFFEGRHQILYRVLSSLQAKSVNVDILTATEELINMMELENVGGVEYLQECADSLVAVSNLDFYINIVKDQSILRKMLITIRNIDEKYRTEKIDKVDDFLTKSEEMFKESIEKRRISSFKTSEEIANALKMNLDTRRANTEDNITGLTSGFDNLNKITNGFQKKELTIVAARPSVGKTALALNFAYRVATRKNLPVAIFSLEMSSETLIQRLVAAESNVSLTKLSNGTYNDVERASIANAIKVIGAAPIFVDDTSNIKLMDLIAKSRQLQAKHPDLSMIVIDYLGLITMSDDSRGKSDNRQEEVRKISLALKGLAKELAVPIVVLSQLSRNVEARDTRRPLLSDLRDSGSIEQDADVVMLLFREDYYKDQKKNNFAGNKKAKDLSYNEKISLMKEKLGDQVPGDASYIEINVAKNRNGQTGTVGLFFYKAFSRFEAPTKEWEEEMRNITNSMNEQD